MQEEFKDIHDLLQTNSMSSSVSGSESQSTKQLQICQCGCKTVQICHVVSRKLQTCQCLTMDKVFWIQVSSNIEKQRKRESLNLELFGTELLR